MLLPIVMSPLLFVYGELLPKNLFYQAPNFLLRFCAPLFLFFTIVFAPAAAILWAMGQLLERLVGQSPEKIRLTLARKELATSAGRRPGSRYSATDPTSVGPKFLPGRI